MNPIINSLLEDDLYKFTMQQVMVSRHPDAIATYEFVCRNPKDTLFPLSELVDEVREQIAHLCTLRFKPDELDYLRGLRFIKGHYVDYLRNFQLHLDQIEITADGDTLRIRAHGPQVQVMKFEIHVLAIVNECYFRRVTKPSDLEEGQRRLMKKVELIRQVTKRDSQVTNLETRRHPFEFFDFGLRRRHSGKWQRHVVDVLRTELPENFKGTSNVLLAKERGITPFGTFAHELLQSYQAYGGRRLRDFQKAALEDWVQEYRGDLGIALTDVVGMDAFLADFDLYFAKLFDGLRHDSGDPYEWAEKAIAHYEKLRIDPFTKRLVFSDGLTTELALFLWRAFADRAKPGFGIGTHFSNDTGLKPLNIVMKVVEVNGDPVAKLSDTPGKTLCKDETYLAYLRQVFKIEPISA